MTPSIGHLAETTANYTYICMYENDASDMVWYGYSTNN